MHLPLFVLFVAVALFASSKAASQRAPYDPNFGIDDPRTLTVNGTQLAYVERGKGAPVVVVHGSASDFRVWQSFVKEASSKYRVFAYSRRYFYPNPSSRTLPKFQGPTDVKDLIAFIEALRVGPVHLVGHSSGGHASLIVAAERPELIRTLVVAEGGFLGGPGAPNAGVDSSSKARALLEAGKDEEAVRTFVDEIGGAGTFDRLLESDRRRMLDNRMALGLPLSPPPNCQQVGLLRMPILLVTGADSPPFLQAGVKGLSDCNPAAKRVTVPKAAHAMHIDNPAVFNAAVIRFLNENER